MPLATSAFVERGGSHQQRTTLKNPRVGVKVRVRVRIKVRVKARVRVRDNGVGVGVRVRVRFCRVSVSVRVQTMTKPSAVLVQRSIQSSQGTGSSSRLIFLLVPNCPCL